MKAFFPASSIFITLFSLNAWANESVTVAGPFTQLRTAPVFEAETVLLSKNWGPALPIDRPFRVEKIYGRWIYGTAEPLPRMAAKEFAPPGWIFSRFLLKPGDQDTQSPSTRSITQGIIFHSKQTWEKLGISKDAQLLAWNFYENLVLSKLALDQFIKQDQKDSSSIQKSIREMFSNASNYLSPTANAVDPTTTSIGFTGADLGFLDQEFQIVQKEKETQRKQREALKLKPPGSPPLTDSVRLALLGRYIASDQLILPPLNHEEVDGFFYMKAVAHRALSGCNKKVQDYWKNRHWNFFRFYRFKKGSGGYPWQEVSLPGGYFGISAKAIDFTSDESELAFLLVRQLVRESKLKFARISFPKDNWISLFKNKSEEIFQARLKSQSGKFSENLDVSDEIQIDLLAAECLEKSGYLPQSGHTFLRKISFRKEESWSQWFFQQAIGFDYRTEQLGIRLKRESDSNKWSLSGVSNQKRFSSVVKQWNLMP
jgi:hypothetical protein